MRLKDSREQSPPILEAYAYRTRGDNAPDELSFRIDCKGFFAVVWLYRREGSATITSLLANPLDYSTRTGVF